MKNQLEIFYEEYTSRIDEECKNRNTAICSLQNELSILADNKPKIIEAISGYQAINEWLISTKGQASLRSYRLKKSSLATL